MVTVERILKGAVETVAVAITGGTGAATVTAAKRGDGSDLTPAPAVSGTAGAYTVALTAAHTATLDALRLTVTAANGASAEVLVEVVGGFLFSLADARKPGHLEDAVEYPDADVRAARLLAERALEDACGCAFVPRYAREVLDGTGAPGDDLLVSAPFVRAVRSVAVNGTAWASGDVSAVVPQDHGALYSPSGFIAGRFAVAVEYEHGMEYPPGEVALAALRLAEWALVDSPVDPRASAITNPDGTYQLLVTAGMRGAVFSVPEANAVVQRYGGFRAGVA